MTHSKCLAFILIGFLVAPTAKAQEQTFGPAAEFKSTTMALPQLKLKELSATRDRPLFVQDRRPLPVISSSLPVAGPLKKQPPFLRGIIVYPLSTIVVLQDPATSDSIAINSGDNFGPWKVNAESDHAVTLTEGNEKILLDLFEQ